MGKLIDAGVGLQNSARCSTKRRLPSSSEFKRPSNGWKNCALRL
jgi:hypothetical protein